MKQGFSLIELLVTLAIIGILSVLCFPIYWQHIAKTRRIEAEATLIHLASALEQFYTEHHSFADASLSKLGFINPIAENYYQLSIHSATDHHFEVAATPLKNQDARCGTLILSDTGEKKISGSGAVWECW